MSSARQTNLEGPPASSPPEFVTWHDAEHGAYTADLALWGRLAGEQDGPVVDLGAGTGRVALHLAARGHSVIAVDNEQLLLDALSSRARDRRLEIETVCSDVRSLQLPDRYSLIIAPMQFLHILGGVAGRREAFARISEHLSADGQFWAGVLDEPLAVGSGRPDPIPDVREVDGWVYSSLPIEIRVTKDLVRLSRLRQLVAPDGNLTEAPSVITLDRFSIAKLDRDAASAGLKISGAERVPSTVEHEDSLALRMEHSDA
jgi:SAM-dependent methyltransferase